MTEFNYVFKAEIPTLQCLECGNTRRFTVMFSDSTIEVMYEAGKQPIVHEWTDTGKDTEITCDECGSQDITIDDLFFT